MKLRLSKPIDADQRERLAKLISCTIQGEDIPNLPYKPNKGDDYYWTVNEGNDWKVKFFPEDDRSLEIIHRYNSEAGVKAMTEWLNYTFANSEIIKL